MSKRRYNLIPLEIKTDIYRWFKNGESIKNISDRTGINYKSCYSIAKKITNDKIIKEIKTESSASEKENEIKNEENEIKNEEIETEYIEYNEENKKKIENVEEEKEKWETENDETDNDESNNDETEKKPTLTEFLNKEKIIDKKENNEVSKPKIINLEIEQSSINNIEIKPIKWILKKNQNIMPEDIDLCTNNKNLDLQNNEKNNYIIKIRKYYDIFNDDLKNIITKQKINSLFKLEVEELKSIYFLLKLEIQYNTSLNIEYLADTTLTGIEKISKVVGVNLDGLKDDLLTNELFIKNLQIIGIENWNIYEFLTPKKIILLLLLKSTYKRFEINNLNNKIEKITTTKIDENLKEKYKNI